MNDIDYTAEEVRAGFEKWLRSQGYDSRKDDHGNYVGMGQRDFWPCWQAAYTARLEADEKAKPVYCTPVEHGDDVAYLHTDQPITNSDYFLLFTYYDEEIAAREAGEPFDESATLDWKDGWRDTNEEMLAAQQESKAATAGGRAE